MGEMEEDGWERKDEEMAGLWWRESWRWSGCRMLVYWMYYGWSGMKDGNGGFGMVDVEFD